MKHRWIWTLIGVVAAAPAFGDSITLGAAAGFGMLGGTISNTGTSTVTGNIGATSTITGFPPGTTTGFACTPTSPGPCTPANDSGVTAGYNAFVNFFNTAASDPSTQTFTDLTQNRTFLGNNVYSSTLTDVVSTAGINLTFDAGGNSAAIFIIQIDRNLVINGPLTFTLSNGAAATNIFWIVGGSETITPTSVPITWDGNILAGTSFTMSAATGGSGVLAGTINGCVFAETANTLAGQTVVNGGCSSTEGIPVVPEPASAGLVSLAGLLGLAGWGKFQSCAS